TGTSMHSTTNSIRASAFALAVAWSAVALTSPATAQEIDAGKRVWGNTAQCTSCHGWAGNGAPEGPGYPAGANLRNSMLDRAQMKEFIQCGKPGTEMPSFARAAWGTLKCFG